MQKIQSLVLLSFIVLSWGCTPPKEESIAEIPSFLPLLSMSTENLEEFTTEGTNWQVVGEVYADLNEAQDFELIEGSGVLVNNQTEEAKSHLFSNLEHGDLEFEIEFMMPKGSNSGIYFQSRYEIQLFDSWGKEEVTYADCGGIYERWDDSKAEGEQGYEGHAPPINASLAPGLWQHYRVLFKAPRFDAEGNKVANARFDSVYHNGMLIHAGVEVTGPTRAAAFEDEVHLAPLMIQGDHGKVAFRNIRYKAYGADTLQLANIQYELFESPGDKLPNDFDALTLIQTGAAEDFKVSELSEENNHFAVRYTADLEVGSAGEYLFTTWIDDGGNLSIDGNLVVNNEGDPGGDTERGLVTLSEGTHQLELTFYQEVWLAMAEVSYEGPGIYKRYLGGHTILPWKQKPKERIIVNPGADAEMIRGFVKHGGEKLTHTISVGDPKGIHFSYDLSKGALLKVWRGAFADVTDMWHERGEAQLLKPLEASIQTPEGIPVLQANEETFRYKGHQIAEGGRPVFQYDHQGVRIKDQLSPSDGGQAIERMLSLEGLGSLDYRIAEGENIRLLENGLYYIDGQYYLQFDEQNKGLLSIEESKEKQQLVASLGEAGLTYRIIW
ncbi:MAG: family 16 glycoside hydrolase [Bacteroidota bacterium]